MDEKPVPEPKKDLEYKYRDEKQEKFIEGLARSRIVRPMLNFFLSTVGRIILFSKFLQDSDLTFDRGVWRRFFDNRTNRGLFEGSIIQNPLYTPNPDGETLKRYDAQVAGWWCGFDLKRRKRKYDQEKYEGRLFTMILSEIKENKATTYTPDDLLNPWNAYHIAHLECPSMQYAIDNGLVEQTTYGEAYRKLGIYEQYAQALEVTGITDEPIFQVTPKGNTLVAIRQPKGERKPTEKPQEQGLEERVAAPVGPSM